MERKFSDRRLTYILANIRERESLDPGYFDGVDVLIHAAAMKHVPYAEKSPEEFVRTNVIGGINIADAAQRARIPKVVALSTDKGSSPATVYGATKFTMERIFTARGFVCTRYGNVAGSSGSLIPTLLEQRKTGKVQLTDPRMTRFYMEQEEAVALVIRALSADPGMVLIPKLPSVRVVDVIAAIAPECEVETIGIRGFEKIHECLISQDEMYAASPWITDGVRDYCLGSVDPIGLDRPYDSGTNDRFLSVAEIRERVLGEEAKAA